MNHRPSGYEQILLRNKNIVNAEILCFRIDFCRRNDDVGADEAFFLTIRMRYWIYPLKSTWALGALLFFEIIIIFKPL